MAVRRPGYVFRALGEIQKDLRDLGIELDAGIPPDEAVRERLDEPVTDAEGTFHRSHQVEIESARA